MLSTYNVYFIDPNLPSHGKVGDFCATFWCDAANEQDALDHWAFIHPNCELIDVTNVGLREE